MKLFMYVWYAIWLLAVLFALIRGFAFVFMVMAETSLGIGILVFLVHMFFVLPAIATVILVIKS